MNSRGPWIAVLLLGSVVSAGYAQQNALPQGRIINKVKCTDSPGQSYALYLPTGYNATKGAPIIYGFDAGARGSLPVKRFKDAAEKYGYILAGSNNSRNGPREPIQKAFDAMWKDTHARFSVDDSRVYMTGFSGGARVACRFACLPEPKVAGVVACSGGFSPDSPPRKGLTFVFFGTAGTTDFNLNEMKRLDRTLDTLGIPNRVRVFKGGHMWPPKVLCMEAVQWLEIMAMRQGIRDRDDTLIKTLYGQRLKNARWNEKNKKTYDAYVLYTELVEDFQDLCSTDESAARVTELGKTETVQTELKHREEQRRKREAFQRRLVKTYQAVIAAHRNDRAKLVELVRDLYAKVSLKDESDDKKMAVAVLRQLAMHYQRGVRLMLQKQYDQAIINMELGLLAAPRNQEVLYNLSCAYALSGRKPQAVAYLKQAVAVGYRDVGHIEKDKDLDAIREDPGYQEIVRLLKGETKVAP